MGTPYSVSASVTVTAPGAGTPGGSITVSDGTDNCVITLPAPSCNLTSTTTGAKTLTATYDGDASFNGSVSAGVPHAVNPAGPTPTTTAVTLVNPTTAVYGQTVNVTVQVTASSGALAPTGGVTVTAGGEHLQRDARTGERARRGRIVRTRATARPRRSRRTPSPRRTRATRRSRAACPRAAATAASR